MTRTVPAALQTHLAGTTTSTATLWTITRRDGVILRFTNHDQDIVFGGNTYDSAVGYQRSDIASNATLAVDTLDLMGILNSAKISETDLRAERYDYAEARIALVNWASPADGEIALRTGFFGEIVYDEKSGSFTTELRGLTQVYAQTIIEQYGRGCRYDYGDSRCNRDGTQNIEAATVQNNTAYAVGDEVRVLRAGAANPPLTEDYNDTNYRVTVAGTTNATLQFVFHSSLGPDADTGVTTLSVTAPSTFTRPAGSFIDDGFVTDMVVTTTGFTNGANNGDFRITGAVSATSMTVTAASLVNETGDADEQMVQVNISGGVTFAADAGKQVGAVVFESLSSNEVTLTTGAGGLLASPLVVLNAGFETGDLTDWTLTAGAVQFHTAATGEVRSGIYSLQIPDNWTGSNYAHLEQTRDVSGYAAPIDAGGETITVSWYQWGNGGAAGQIQVNYDFLDEDDVSISGTTGTFKKVINGTFQLQSQQDIIPALTRKIVIEFRGGAGVGEPFVDDISVSTSLVDPNFPAGELEYGVLRFETGLNAGLARVVKSYDPTSKIFTLFLPLPLPITVGDKVSVHIGCNKELSTCRDKFDNIINHGGYPFVPQDDEFLRYPDSPY